MQEKEDQCKTFKELLLEKENEIQELGARVEANENMAQKLHHVLLALGQPVSEAGGIICNNNNCQITR